MHSIRIIGPGRAGTSLAAALSARGWEFAGFLGRHDELARAADGVDLLVIATPDDAVAEVAAAVVPSPGTTVAHLSGSLGLDALAPHPLRAGRAPAGAAAQRRGRCRPPRLRRHLRRGRGRRWPATVVDQPGRPHGRGGRRGPGGVPRRRLHRGQPCGGAAGPGGAGGRLGRAGPRVVPPPDAGRRRRRGRPGRRPGADRPGPPRRLGHAQPPPRRPARVRAPRLPGRRRAGHPPGPRRTPPPPLRSGDDSVPAEPAAV